MDVAVLDSDTIIDILEKPFHHDKDLLLPIIDYLRTRYSRAWIPATVKNEFYGIPWGQRGTSRRKRKRAEKIFSFIDKLRQGWMTPCPIRSSKTEIEGLITKGIDPGEIDSVLQAKKALSHERYRTPINSMTFISGDTNALHFARKMSIGIVPLDEIKADLRQFGIPIP